MGQKDLLMGQKHLLMGQEDPPLCSAAAVASLLMALPRKTPWRHPKDSSTNGTPGGGGQ